MVGVRYKSTADEIAHAEGVFRLQTRLHSGLMGQNSVMNYIPMFDTTCDTLKVIILIAVFSELWGLSSFRGTSNCLSGFFYTFLRSLNNMIRFAKELVCFVYLFEHQDQFSQMTGFFLLPTYNNMLRFAKEPTFFVNL